MTLDEARRASMLADSYSRIATVVLAPLSRSDWFRLLGSEWTDCDSIWTARAMIRAELRDAGRDELDSMMTEVERTALAQLPARFTIYRGCYAINRAGLSWSLERSIAEGFPRRTRYLRPGEQPILRLGTCARERVVLKLDRNEREIVAAHVWGIQEEPLTIDGEPT
jgi:hypothetical protein